MRKIKRKNRKQEFVVKKERLITISISVKTIIQSLAILLFLFIIWYILYYKWIYIYINKEKNKYESFLFSVLVSCTLLMFQLACGFDLRVSNKYLKPIFISIVLLIVYYGYQYYGLGFIIYKNYGLLYHNQYESNSKHGLLFFTENWLFWSFVYIASLILMSRDD